jgi:ribosomal protein L11 methylase PrmA
MLREAYRREYGRELNNYSEIYRLPADSEELERLSMFHIAGKVSIVTHRSQDMQHQMLMGVVGKYPPCMEEVLEDRFPAEPKQVLDLGCGSGAW